MKFDDRYPQAQPGIEPALDATVMLGEKGHACSECNDHTFWHDTLTEYPLCSEECSAAHWSMAMETKGYDDYAR